MDKQKLQEELQHVDSLLDTLLESLDNVSYSSTTVEDSDRKLTPDSPDEFDRPLKM